MTASADYGVSIVESFVPPENWVPGQTIKKEVFAVNTGNIDAFVEEEVSGLMTYSYETLVDSYGVAGVKYEPLGLNADDEAKSKQAGGYLIWNNAGVPNGSISDDWTPPADGDYIFRRAIDTATNIGGTNVSAERYALEGYHYDATGVDYDNDATTPLEHYFKIKIAGNDDDARLC